MTRTALINRVRGLSGVAGGETDEDHVDLQVGAASGRAGTVPPAVAAGPSMA